MKPWAHASALAVIALAACANEEPVAGRACGADGDCDGLACLEGICAPVFDDPGGEPEPSAGPVRVHAVGLHPVVADHESQETFCAWVRGVVASEVAPSSDATPTLIVFPENSGLMAPVIGERGAAARTETTITGAYLALGVTYDAAANYYIERATSRIESGRLVTLAVTDTLWRSLECFATVARERGAWVAVTYNVADAERTTDAAEIAMLVDEGAADRSYAYRAIGDAVVNQTLLYDPEGEIAARWVKEYLVPDEESALALAYGAYGNLRPVALPWGPTASVISKDAWMPDVLDRLALEGTRLVLQPEAFSGWGVAHGEDAAWAPDVVKESGWAHVMRYRSFRANAMACLSANVFEMVFDCQSAIAVDPAFYDTPPGGFIGQDPDVGFADVAPWVIDDDGMGTLEERRARLMETGELLLPESGDALENGYVAGTASAVLDLAARTRDPPPLGGIVEGEQRRPAAVALDDGTTFVIAEDTRNGPARLYGVRVGADGSLGEARMRVPGDGPARAPRLAALGQTVHLAWQERVNAVWQVRYARSTDGGRSFPAPIVLSDETADAWVPDVAVDPATNDVHVVFVDTREGAGRIYAARSADGGGSFAPAAPVEPAREGAYDTRQNRWAPAVAARDGTVAIAWADFRSFAWEIWGAFSSDRGASFDAPARLDDADVPHETIHSDPRLAFTDAGEVLLAWTDLRVRHPDYDVRARTIVPSDPGAATASIVLASTDAAARPQWEPAITVNGSSAAVAWQDFRDGSSRVRIAFSGDGGRSFGADRLVDDEIGWSPAPAMLPDGRVRIAYESSSGALGEALVEAP